jgi:sulfite reductase (NADPH) flavoprotein alpha-component
MPSKRKIIPENAPFTAQEAEWLDHFFTQMSPEQATWLNGFVSGFQAFQLTGTVSRSSTGPALETLPPAPAPRAAAPASFEKPKLLILYGSESGNAEGLAAEAKKLAQRRGIKATIVDMADSRPSDLVRESALMVCVSTWGEGDPPERAGNFYRQLMADDAPRFDGMRFAVLGLGDTAYEQFCQMGKDFDKRLETLGATRIHDRIDCDVDYEDAANKWLLAALESFENAATPVTQPEVVFETAGSQTTVTPVESSTVYGKKNPFPARLNERVVLNGTGSNKETLHLELSLEGSGLTYEPGDALAVLPVNCDEVVTDIIKAANLSSEQSVTNKNGESIPLHTYIMTECDATVLSKVFLQKYVELHPNEAIQRLLQPEAKGELQDFLWGREILDILVEFPIPNLSPENLISLLRKLPPRLYSIASSMKAVGDEVHLTVAAVRYFTHRRNRKGVCSTFMADRVNIGGEIPVYVQPNKHFKLPEDPDTPIIMVGPGTGIAPFRSFMQERQSLGAKGKNWLIFGDQHFTYDFLYQLEWQDYAKDGLLTRMDTAFSRDTPEKVYVQHRMLERSRDLYEWLQDGAYFYVCGDASRMANDVHQALKTILMQEGSLSESDADAQLETLKKEKRYQRDVY